MDRELLESPAALAMAFMAGFQLRGEKEGWPESTMTEIQNVMSVLMSQSEAARKVANPLADYAGYDGLGPGPEYWRGMAKEAVAALGINTDG